MFDVPLKQYMTVSIVSIGETATLDYARELMVGRGISALPVLDANGRTAGVISRSDLLRVGREQRRLGEMLVLDGAQVRDVMTRALLTVSSEGSVGEAARHFVDGHVHRVFVESEGRVIGVLSGRDLIAAVAERGLSTPLSSVMSSPLRVIDGDAALGAAVDHLVDEEVSSLVVVGAEERPVGVFSRLDALRAARSPASTRLVDVMSVGAPELPASTPVCDAARRALEQRVRQILVTDDGSLRRTEPPGVSRPAKRKGAVGIVTSTDLAGAALMAGWVG